MSQAAAGNAIAQYKADGNLAVGDAVNDEDALNKATGLVKQTTAGRNVYGHNGAT